MNEPVKDPAFQKLCEEVEYAPTVSGILMTDVLSMPDELRRFLSWVLRQKLTDLAEIAAFLRQEENAVSVLVNQLIAKGYLEIQPEVEATYRANTRQSGGPSANLAQRPRRDLLALLGQDEEE